MNPDEYAAQQAVISQQVFSFVRAQAAYLAPQQLRLSDWLGLLQRLFPYIQFQRDAAARLGRRFYDSERHLAHPSLKRADRPLEGTDWKMFVRNMDPARQRMMMINSPNDALTHLAFRAVREVENAGRQQIIHAVENDPEPEILRGWARVATGAETCAWCLMLVSRGPVYLSAESAGLAGLSDRKALSLIAAGTDLSGAMEEWHDNCDCKVVPVFKQKFWSGQAAADRALEAWNDAVREATAIQDGPGPTIHPRGKRAGQPMTLNEEAINAFRRRLARGDVSVSEFAGLKSAA